MYVYLARKRVGVMYHIVPMVTGLQEGVIDIAFAFSPSAPQGVCAQFSCAFLKKFCMFRVVPKHAGIPLRGS